MGQSHRQELIQICFQETLQQLLFDIGIAVDSWFILHTCCRASSQVAEIVHGVLAGNPLHNGIVWLDRRTAGICQQIKEELGSGVSPLQLLYTNAMPDSS